MQRFFDIVGRKAIVTGGGRGIGHAFVQGLLEAGVQVAILDVDPDIKKNAQNMSPTAFGIRTDLTNTNQREQGFMEAVALLGGLDILVNNAGIQVKHDFLTYPLETWSQIVELNLTCAFHLMQLAGRIMKSQGSGKIINISSMNAFFGGTNCPAYAATKAGIVQLTKSASNELSRYNINANAIAPGFIETELTRHIIEESSTYENKRSRIPKGRWGKPEDLVGTMLFLASPASDYLCGAVIPVDGGYLCK